MTSQRLPGQPAQSTDPADLGEKMMTDLQAAQLRLQQLSVTRSAQAATRWAEGAAPLLAPAWQIIVTDQDARAAFGMLRGIGASVVDRGPAWHNLSILRDAVKRSASGSLDISEPTTVLSLLRDPCEALLESVRVADMPEDVVRIDYGVDSTMLEPAPRPHVPSLNDPSETIDRIAAELRQLFRQWLDITRGATSDRRELAQLLLAAAFLAREAVIQGDRSTLEWFVHRWLGYGATDARIDGAAAALLENGWFPRFHDDDLSESRDRVTRLRTDVIFQHRVHRPVWETRIHGQAVGALTEQDMSAWSNDGYQDVDRQALARLELRRVRRALKEVAAGPIADAFLEGLSKAEIRRELGVSRYRVDKAIDDLLRTLNLASVG